MDAFVTVPAPVTDAHLAAIQATGVRVLRVYEAFGVVYVVGAGADVLELSHVPGALRVSGNEKLQLHLSTATVATNARDVWDTRSTSTTPVTVGGVVVDGSGVGVAVVDSGVDATHPDLAPAVVANFKWSCGPVLLSGNCAEKSILRAVTDNPGSVAFPSSQCDRMKWEAVPNSDATSGHGTHVAGIVAGRGIASGGRHVGAAPGAGLYGFGAGEGPVVLVSAALDAFQWVFCYHDVVTPAIRVVTNSWGDSPGASGTSEIPFEPSDPISVATNALVDEGIVVVYSASNDGGDGSLNMINAHAKNPKPGVISVANYEDQDSGTRTGALHATSSRGRASEPAGEQWPDVAAPGTGILSTRAKSGAYVAALGHPGAGGGRFSCCDTTQNEYVADYVSISGTSMAAPHVTGIIALLLQANPALTPAQIEEILEDTASPLPSAGAYVADPTNPGTSTNHAAGHGLVDALAAVKDARVGTTTGAGSPPPRFGSKTILFQPLIDPQQNLHVKYVNPAGPAEFATLNFASGGTPVPDGSSIRYVVNGGAPTDATVAAQRTDVTLTLEPGQNAIELQFLLDGVWRAFDTVLVEAV